MLWIWLSILASVFFALRHVVIKKYLSNTDTMLTAFSTRLFGFLYLIPFLYYYKLEGVYSIEFLGTTLITALLTAIASIMQLKAIQKFDLSSSVPFLAFIPLFMILPVYLIFGELPNYFSIIGLLVLSFGGVLVNSSGQHDLFKIFMNILNNKGSLLFLGVALIFGITTTIDRIAIVSANNSGFTYTFVWHIISTLIFSFIFLNVKKIPFYISESKKYGKWLAIQGLFGIIAFLMQMIAVEYAKQVNANVIYIKAITLLQLLISVLFGIIIFKEKHAKYRIAGAIFMIIGAIVVIVFSY